MNKKMNREMFLKEMRQREDFIKESSKDGNIIMFFDDNVWAEEEITVSPGDATSVHRGIGKGFVWTEPELIEKFKQG